MIEFTMELNLKTPPEEGISLLNVGLTAQFILVST